MAKKSMAELLEAVTNKKAFKSDDTVSEIEQVGLDKSAPDDEIEELEVDGKSKAGLSAEEKTNKSSTKSGQDKMEKSSRVAEGKEEDEDNSDDEDEDQDDNDSEDEDEEDEDLKEAYRLFGALVEAELDEEFELEEGRMKHPMSPQEQDIKKKIAKNLSLIHYYDKRKQAGTKYNKTKGPGGDVNALKKETEVLRGQLKAMRAKSHPKNKSQLNNSVEVDVRKVTVEDFDSTDDLSAIFGTEDTLTEDFKAKVKTIYEASVVAKANEVVGDVYNELKEAFVTEQGILVDELTEAYSAKVDELIESVDRYLDKTITDWKKENEVQLQSRAKYEIAESFMTKLKVLFEDHYIDLPEEKVSVVDALEAKVAGLEESLQKEIDKNIELQEEIDSKAKAKIIEEMAEGLSDVQKEKFAFLAEAIDLEKNEVFVEKLKEIKTAYFGSSSKKEVIKEEYEEEGVVIDQDKKPGSNVMIDQSVAAISRYLGKK